MQQTCPCAIIGAGPAGLSFLIALCNRVASASEDDRLRLQGLLDSMVILEATAAAGGLMGDYQINANTDAVDVVRGIADETPFTNLRDQYLKLPETQQALIPLPVIGEKLMQPLAQLAATLLGDRLRFNASVKKVVVEDGQFQCLDTDNHSLLRSDRLVLCSGGSEVLLPELSQWQEKTEFTGEFLRRTQFNNLPEASGSLVIIGASHSGFSVAWRFLNDVLLADWIEGREIIILQRGEQVKMRCSPEFATEHQLAYDNLIDICPVTGLVFRNAGLRKDAKNLYIQIRNGEEPRVRLVSIDKLGDQSQLLDEAALVIQGTGFQTNFPEIELNSKPVRLDQNSQQGELHELSSGKVIPGLYGMGLGMQVLPEGPGRGEKSFNGSINGMLSYPLTLAPEIIDHMLAQPAQQNSREAM
jgi:hypothetical protein